MSDSDSGTMFMIDSTQNPNSAASTGGIGNGAVYNMGGFAVPAFPNFSGGSTLSFQAGTSDKTMYALAAAVAVAVLVLLSMKKKGPK